MATKKLLFLTGLLLLCCQLGISAPEKLMAQDSTSIFRLSIEDLMNLSVEISTGMKSSTTSDEVPAAVFVITREDIDRMGLLTLGDALNFVPGFTVGKSIQSGQQKNIYVRGEFSSQSQGILFLYDGQRLNDGISGGAVAFNTDYALDNIKQIEVVRGPVSALYGANAFVAVVNLIPYRPDEITISSFSARAGNRGSLWLNGNQKLSLPGNVDAIIYASFQGLDDVIPQRTIHQEVFDSVSGSFIPRVFSNRLNSEKATLLNIGSSIIYKQLEIDAYFNRSKAFNNWGSGTSVRDSFQNEHLARNVRVDSKFITGFLKNHRLTFLGSYASHKAQNIYKVENFRTVLSPGFNPPGSASIFESDLSTSTINIESYAEFNFSARHRTIIGANLQKDFIFNIDNSTAILDRNGDGIFDAVAADDTLDTVFREKTQNIFAAFLQHTFSPMKLVAFTGGARLDKYSSFGARLSPRLTFVLQPNEQWTLKGMGGRAFRVPTFFETNRSDFNILSGNRLIENPNLRPETIETGELQLTYKPHEAFSFTINAFHNDVQHVIRQVAIEQSGVPTQSKWENAGSRDWSGFEMGLQFSLRNHLSVSANYSYTQTADEKVANKEDPVFGIPKHSFNFGINMTGGKFNLNLNGSSRFGWNDVPAYDSSTVRLERINLVPYTILNARLTAKNIWKSLTLSLDVRNILDQKYYFTDDRIFVPQGIAGNSRRFVFGAQYTF